MTPGTNPGPGYSLINAQTLIFHYWHSSSSYKIIGVSAVFWHTARIKRLACKFFPAGSA
jgi:hypothetical protein